VSNSNQQTASPGTTFYLDPAKLFQEFARTGLPLRDPATDIIGLFCKSAVGCCLNPLIVAGDQIFIDLNARPEHGDIVYFEWPPETVAHWNASDRGADWANRWGAHDMSRGVKLFWEYPHGAPDWVPKENLLLTNEDSTKVGTHKLLGVVRAVIRNGVMLTTLGLAACDSVAPYAAPGSEIPVASIDPNAATTIGSVSITGGSVGGVTPISVANITIGPFPFATTVIMTASGAWDSTAPGGSVNLTLIYGISTSSTSYSGNTTPQSSSPSSTNAQSGTIAQEATFSLAANTSQRYDFMANQNPSGIVGLAVHVTNLLFKAEAIKR
jgi:hypothetical protein